MQTSIKATNYELTPSTREFIEKKFLAIEKLTAGTTSATLACEIEQSMSLERAGAKYRVEGNLLVDGKLFRAEAVERTLEGAVDRMRDGLVRDLLRARGKKQGLVKRGGAALKRLLRLGR